MSYMNPMAFPEICVHFRLDDVTPPDNCPNNLDIGMYLEDVWRLLKTLTSLRLSNIDT